MRKLFICMLALLGTVACDRETIEIIEDGETPVPNARTVTVRAGKAGTRTTIREENGAYFVGWKAGDQLAVIEGITSIAQRVANDEDYNGSAALFYGTEELSTDTDNAEFTLELSERDDVSGELQYVAIYPASAAIDVPDAWDYDKGRIIATIDFPQFQNPLADSFDPKADVLVSKAVTCQAPRPEQLSFEFARVGTIVKMVVNGLPEGSKITDGSLELGMQAGYYMNYDPLKQKMIFSDGTDGIFFSYEEGNEAVVGTDRTATIWLRCLAGVSNRLSLMLNYKTPDGDCFFASRVINLKAKGKTLVFKDGGLTTFTVDLRSPSVSNPEETDIDFKTNNPDLDGIDVWWPVPDNEYLQGYECLLSDEDGTMYTLTGSMGDETYTASISSGLAPGVYTLFVRALAVEGKISQQDYVEKELKIGIPISLNISYPSSHNTSMDDYWDLNLDKCGDQASRDLYKGIYFNLRYLDWHSGSPNH
ncbi:MAG: hypothetical protein IJJ96_04910, partial [Bacteroidales bacterium]|nr:hypothetical protein [Bacteroidales bacterium]